jgi:sensor domain CHASE-containing protein
MSNYKSANRIFDVAMILWVLFATMVFLYILYGVEAHDREYQRLKSDLEQTQLELVEAHDRLNAMQEEYGGKLEYADKLYQILQDG